MSLFDVYARQQAAIVMAGDSLIARADWNELLDRNDVANRGIGSDTTAGLRARLDSILALDPRVVFIMTGRNDVREGRTVEQIADDFDHILRALRDRRIAAVLHAIVFIGLKPNAERRNHKFAAINDRIRHLGREHGCRVIDLNPLLAPAGRLEERYTHDGGHLLGAAYALWREEIHRVLRATEFKV